jgi:hypothetical protein
MKLGFSIVAWLLIACCWVTVAGAVDPAGSLVQIQLDQGDQTKDSFGLVTFTLSDRTYLLCHLSDAIVAAGKPAIGRPATQVTSGRAIWGTPARTVNLEIVRYLSATRMLLAGPSAELPPALPELSVGAYQPDLPLKVLGWEPENGAMKLLQGDGTIRKVFYRSVDEVSHLSLNLPEKHPLKQTVPSVVVTENGEIAAYRWPGMDANKFGDWEACNFQGFRRYTVTNYGVQPLKLENGKVRYLAAMGVIDPFRQVTAARMYLKFFEGVGPVQLRYGPEVQFNDATAVKLTQAELPREIEELLPTEGRRKPLPGEVRWFAELEVEAPKGRSPGCHVQVATADAQNHISWRDMVTQRLEMPKP